MIQRKRNYCILTNRWWKIKASYFLKCVHQNTTKGKIMHFINVFEKKIWFYVIIKCRCLMPQGQLDRNFKQLFRISRIPKITIITWAKSGVIYDSLDNLVDLSGSYNLHKINVHLSLKNVHVSLNNVHSPLKNVHHQLTMFHCHDIVVDYSIALIFCTAVCTVLIRDITSNATMTTTVDVRNVTPT